MKKYPLILFFSLGILFNVFGQENKEKIPLREFIVQVEQKFNVKCFYDEKWLDKYEVFNSLNESDIDSVMNKALVSNNLLKYFIYQDEYVIFSEVVSIDLREKNIQSTEENMEEQKTVDNAKNEKIIHQIGIPGLKERISTISGTVMETVSKQRLPGVSIVADDGTIGTTTNENGEYEIYLTKGYHVITYSYMGMEPTIRKIRLYSSGNLDVNLDQKANLLEEISIIGTESKKEKQIIGYNKLKTLDINEIPSFMGEVDIIKHSLLLPGIQSVGEMDMSFNVRGGKGDQNLILIDGVHTYSHSHFFGLFPGINPYSIENATLYKASMPIEYGNRLSSVYDIEIKDGNFNKFEFEGGISPVSSNLSVNGPIIKEKLSFNTSLRGTYSNWVLNLMNVDELENSTVSFYDYNFKLSYKPNLKNQYSVFYTRSYDDFTFNDEINYQTYNTLATVNFKNYLKNEMALETIFGYSGYKIRRIETPSIEFASIKEHTINDFKLNSKVSWDLNESNHIITGLELVYQEVSPWNVKPKDSNSTISTIDMIKDKGIKTSLFLGDKLKLINNFTLDVGVRLSTYAYLGANNVYKYTDGILSESYIMDTLSYSNNEIINFDWGPEFRISGNYELNINQNINFCYNRNRQYISILTNTQAITPVASWQLSNEYIPPQIADHYSLGYNLDFYNQMFTVTLEGYYKKIQNMKDFKNGSKFELNSHPETEIVNAEGKAYGIEFMLEKNVGRISGWISYTYSRSFIKSDSDIEEKIVNDGNYYPTSYDKPHNISAVINFEPTKRFKISNVVNFNSGTPATLPVSKITIDDSYYLIYSDRNQYRLPYYLRWDVSVSVRGRLKRNKKLKGLLTFSVYNVLGRHNPYSVYFENENQNIKGYQLSIFSEPIPTVTYKFNL